LNIDNLTKELKISSQESIGIIKRSVEIARKAQRELSLQDVTLVAGSVGPYGACKCDGSEYTGNYVDEITFEELVFWHRPRIEALIEEGVDLLAIETIPSINEAKAICQVIKEHKETKAWLTFSCKVR
jgi:homocysteine S-methyltransferase